MKPPRGTTGVDARGPTGRGDDDDRRWGAASRGARDDDAEAFAARVGADVAALRDRVVSLELAILGARRAFGDLTAPTERDPLVEMRAALLHLATHVLSPTEVQAIAMNAADGRPWRRA